MSLEANVGKSLIDLKDYVKGQLTVHLGGLKGKFLDAGLDISDVQWIIDQTHGSVEKSFTVGMNGVLSTVKNSKDAGN
tara:strand:- start:21468 stop:21701 length:234 start_codon:yes stop_codon:yes gene_type:complete